MTVGMGDRRLMVRNIGRVVAFWCLAITFVMLAACGNDGNIEVRPAPEVPVVASPTPIPPI